MSSNGNILAVGAYGKDSETGDDNYREGSVYIFRYDF